MPIATRPFLHSPSRGGAAPKLSARNASAINPCLCLGPDCLP